MARTRKASIDNDKLTDTNIARVIKLLNPTTEGEKPITKKTACEIIGIAYNSTRLGSLIEAYEERTARDKARRAEKRGKSATSEEIVYAIQEYLNGETIDSISKSLYRSSTMVKQILEKNGVPIRQVSHSYFKPELIPEDAVSTSFEIGEIVYSARYDCTAKVYSEAAHPVWGKVYKIWLLSVNQKQVAFQPACELASLKHLRELGVTV